PARRQPRRDRDRVAQRREARHDRVTPRPAAAPDPGRPPTPGGTTMHVITNMKLMPKLMLAFGILLLIMLVQGAGAYMGMRSMDRTSQSIAQGALQIGRASW